jgi:methylphosphonate synthase
MRTVNTNAAENKRAAENFQSILNDLKRRPEDAAADLDLDLSDVLSILAGKTAVTQEIVEKATQVWPVSNRDFYLLRDDAPQAVRVMRAAESAASSRTMKRAGEDYYEYRDTAMSSVAAFRPEWIRELCVVDDNDADNASVQWNNGHFLHQFTYFIGPVNFYFKDSNGTKSVAVMNTGDSMYIAPYVPHTFTTRRNSAGENGLILALTYGNKLTGDAQQELSLLGRDEASSIILNFDTADRATGELIRFHREALTMPISELAVRLQQPLEVLEAIERGETRPDANLLETIARELNVSIRDLLASGAGADRVQVQLAAEARRWSATSDDGAAAYDITELCGALQLPFSKALELEVKVSEDDESVPLQAGLHQFIYNIGMSAVKICWTANSTRYSDVVDPGDSLYMKPGVEHAFSGVSGRLLVLRIGGRVGGDTLHELSTVGRGYLPRILGESMQWFDPKGRSDIDTEYTSDTAATVSTASR